MPAKRQPREFFIRAMPITDFMGWVVQNGWYEVYREHMRHIYLTPQGRIIEVSTDADNKGIEQKVKAVTPLNKWERQN